MTKQTPLETLIGMAKGDVDTAAQKLARLRREAADAQGQLDGLIQYRDEYHARFNASAGAGMPAGNVRNFQAFIDTLDAAIEQQRALAAKARARADAALPEWQNSKRKLGSYETLQARKDAADARVAARREQRDTDEYAQRALRMRASSET